jgi:hypothetical protein
MDQVAHNEYYEALGIIVGEQQLQMALATAGDSQLAIAGGRGELSTAAKGYLSQAVAVLSGTNTSLTADPVPLLARAGALIALELARIVRIRRQTAAGELITPVFLEEKGSDLVVHAFQVTNPFTGKLAGLTKERCEAETLLRRILGRRW